MTRIQASEGNLAPYWTICFELLHEAAPTACKTQAMHVRTHGCTRAHAHTQLCKNMQNSLKSHTWILAGFVSCYWADSTPSNTVCTLGTDSNFPIHFNPNYKALHQSSAHLWSKEETLCCLDGLCLYPFVAKAYGRHHAFQLDYSYGDNPITHTTLYMWIFNSFIYYGVMHKVHKKNTQLCSANEI